MGMVHLFDASVEVDAAASKAAGAAKPPSESRRHSPRAGAPLLPRRLHVG